MKSIVSDNKNNHDEQNWLGVFEHLPQLVCFQDQQQRIFFNTACRQYLGEAQLIHWNFEDIFHPEDEKKSKRSWSDALQQKIPLQWVGQIQQHDHQFRWFAIELSFPEQQDVQWLISAQDIHQQYIEKKQLNLKFAQQQEILNHSNNGLMLLDPQGNLTYSNHIAQSNFNLTEQPARSWVDLFPENVRLQAQQTLEQAQQGQTAHFLYICQQHNQNTEHWDNTLTPINNANHELQSILCTSQNVHHVSPDEVYQFDDLTGLYTRKAFNQLLNSTLEKLQDRDCCASLILINLDYFRHINETLGHMAGDHLLQVFSQRLTHALDKSAIIARLGSDEFAVLISPMPNAQQLMQVVKVIEQQLEQPIYYGQQYLNGGMSIGCAMYPEDATESFALLTCAATALNEVKHNGRGGMLVFHKSMLDKLACSANQLVLARYLLRHELILPFYQPKVRLTDQKIIGFEALLRWYDKNQELQYPQLIQQAFSDYELASRISEKMQTKVFEDIIALIEADLPVLPISINATPVEFLRDNYAEILLKRVKKYNIPPHLIEIEVTEQSLAEDGSAYIIRALNLMKKNGIRISLDDFGTGYSSLMHLKDYPVDCLKIDRSFVEKIHTDPSILAIIRAITQLGPSMSLQILAEGIELNEQLQSLKDCACDTGQGYYFYRPMDFNKMALLLSSDQVLIPPSI